MHGHAPTQRERASRLKHVLALGRRSTSRAPTAANGDASQGTRWMVSGGARWRKPPSGARLTDVTKRSSRPRSSALMEATTCSWASFRLWLGLGCLEMRSVCAACAVRGERAIGHMHMVGAAGKQASHKDETRQRARARLPEQPHGGRGGRVAAGVGRVRTHVLKVQAAATAAARQQLVDLRGAQQAQPRGRDHLRAAQRVLLACAPARAVGLLRWGCGMAAAVLWGTLESKSSAAGGPRLVTACSYSAASAESADSMRWWELSWHALYRKDPCRAARRGAPGAGRPQKRRTRPPAGR